MLPAFSFSAFFYLGLTFAYYFDFDSDPASIDVFIFTIEKNYNLKRKKERDKLAQKLEKEGDVRTGLEVVFTTPLPTSLLHTAFTTTFLHYYFHTISCNTH